jgi:hypothetical protein
MRKTLCSACGKYFVSTRTFDRHRTGAYGLPPGHRHGRRCFTTTELEAAGWSHEPHRITDEQGQPTAEVWFDQKRREKSRQSFAKHKSGCP